MVTHRRSGTVAALVILGLLGGCAAEVGDFRAGGEPAASPSSSAGPTLPSSQDVGPYKQGDCLALEGNVIDFVDCERPHEYEVMLSNSFEADVADTYPPDTTTLVKPACYAGLPVYLGNPDAAATRIEPLTLPPNEEQWRDGERWFTCLLVERGPDNEAFRRTGSLAGALSDGLGEYQRCQVDEPLSDGPLKVVPCDEPHRSEAVPGVLVHGLASDPAPSIEEMTGAAIDHCTEAVEAYLGGDRPGVDPMSVSPLPEDWKAGKTFTICYAVSDEPVTGAMNTA